MIPDLDFKDPACVAEIKKYIFDNADRFPLVGFDLAKAMVQHITEQLAAPAATSVSGGADEITGAMIEAAMDSKAQGEGPTTLAEYLDFSGLDTTRRVVKAAIVAALAAAPASVTSPQNQTGAIQQVLEKWAGVRPGELDDDAVPLFLDELKLAGLQMAPVLQPAEQAMTALATFVQQAYAYKSTFPGLPEGYTHEDIDRLYEWADGADDLLRTAPQMQAAALTSPVGGTSLGSWMPCTIDLPPFGVEVLTYDPKYYNGEHGHINPLNPHSPAKISTNVCLKWGPPAQWKDGGPTHWMYKPDAPDGQ